MRGKYGGKMFWLCANETRRESKKIYYHDDIRYMSETEWSFCSWTLTFNSTSEEKWEHFTLSPRNPLFSLLAMMRKTVEKMKMGTEILGKKIPATHPMRNLPDPQSTAVVMMMPRCCSNIEQFQAINVWHRMNNETRAREDDGRGLAVEKWKIELLLMAGRGVDCLLHMSTPAAVFAHRFFIGVESGIELFV